MTLTVERPSLDLVPLAAGRPPVTDTDTAIDRRIASDSAELRRFEDTRHRRLRLPEQNVRRWLAGRSVVVTGGTGCVGSRLIRLLLEFGAARVTSISRNSPSVWPVHRDVEYARADVADLEALAHVMRRAAPDVVFNCAGLRDPSEAEGQPLRTVRTNVVGVDNVVLAARRASCDTVVHASTGKAVRLHSAGVYASSKKVAEWVLTSASARYGDMSLGMARFTHLVDNSLIMRRLNRWSVEGGVELHDEHIAFYGQSATEAAQLLIAAGLSSVRGAATTAAIADLEWPFALVELTRAVLRRHRSDARIHVTGYQPGYDEATLPMLYDPRFAGGRSPLISIVETPRLVGEHGTPNVDVFRSARQLGPQPVPLLDGATDGDGRARRRLRQLAEGATDWSLSATPRDVLERMVTLAEPHLVTMDERTRWVHDRVLHWQDRAASSSGPIAIAVPRPPVHPHVEHAAAGS